MAFKNGTKQGKSGTLFRKMGRFRAKMGHFRAKVGHPANLVVGGVKPIGKFSVPLLKIFSTL